MTATAEVKETPTMRLIDGVLTREHGTTLRDFIANARATTPAKGKTPAKTALPYDDIAHALWNMTGTKVVRESVRDWAIRYGVEADPKAKTATKA
jgi:hypothetical protein